jgi:hypothetical protein
VRAGIAGQRLACIEAAAVFLHNTLLVSITEQLPVAQDFLSLQVWRSAVNRCLPTGRVLENLRDPQAQAPRPQRRAFKACLQASLHLIPMDLISDDVIAL